MVAASEREFRISRQAATFIRNLPDAKRKAVKYAVSSLMVNQTEKLNIKRLMPYPKEFRLRVDDIRILFKATKTELFIFKAGFRKDVYR